MKTSTVTMTIANPCVVTWVSHPLAVNDPIKFTTTGALPSGIVSGTTYYVLNTGPNTFNISATPGGTAKAATGSQSGTHTGINAEYGCANNLSTFNVPDLRGEFMRGLDAGRGIDVARSPGTWQEDQFQGHWHTWVNTSGGVMAFAAVAGPPLHAGGDAGWFGISGEARNIIDGGYGSPRYGTETRPRNVALLVCIQFE